MLIIIFAFEWISMGIVPGLEGISRLRREVKWEDSRFDLYGEDENGSCYIEVKNVTLREGNMALFPDAVTERGRKHLNTLIRVREAGMRAVMFFLVQRMDVSGFFAAREIDPSYSETLEEAHRRGVEIIAVQAAVSPEMISYRGTLPVELQGVSGPDP